MYLTETIRQSSFNDFNQSCGIALDPKNEWVLLVNRIDWTSAEGVYRANFSERMGRPATPFRQVLAAMMIQKRMHLSDRALVKAIAENPYYQYFMGLPSFQTKCPFQSTALVFYRKRLSAETWMTINESILKASTPTKEHRKEQSDSTGCLLLDATCSPSNIRYPQDFSLLNEAREKTDAMIDLMHGEDRARGSLTKHPRTYRRILRKAHLAVAKMKKRPPKVVRSLIRKQLFALERNIAIVKQLQDKGLRLTPRDEAVLDIITKLYAQQKEMFDKKTHRVEKRIVSISQPYLRPIVRGKAKAPVEFGAKYDVSIDEKGHARMEKISFDPYNECTVLKDAVERYRARTGQYPRRVLVDKIYRTRDNRAFCEARGIMMSGKKPGRPPEDAKEKRRRAKEERNNDIDRIGVERFFSLEKRCSGAGLIMTKLADTTLVSIALSVLVTNLFATSSSIFVLYFMDADCVGTECHFIEFEDHAA